MTLADDGWGSNISYELLAIILALVAMSALPPRADMCGATRDVRFGPKADIKSIIQSPHQRMRLSQTVWSTPGLWLFLDLSQNRNSSVEEQANRLA
jgi:hypothetical protein